MECGRVEPCRDDDEELTDDMDVFLSEWNLSR
jgi:hypothetical protein